MSRDGKTRTGAAARHVRAAPPTRSHAPFAAPWTRSRPPFPPRSPCARNSLHTMMRRSAPGRERYPGSPRRERADSRVNPGKRSRTPSTRPSRNCLQPEATRQSDHFFLAPRGHAGRPRPGREPPARGKRIRGADQRPDVADACRPAPMPGPRPESEKTSLALAMARGEPIAAWARENGVGKRTAYAWAQDPRSRRPSKSYRRRAVQPGDRPECAAP